MLGVAAFACAATIAVTWPQIQHPAQVADHFDPYFSTWRLGHIAHALSRWPVHLFDGNIFHPAKGTLAYSDAVLLQGLIGAPLFWAGLSPTLIYNLLLYAGFVGSGVAIFVLARHLTGAIGPSLVATAIFTMLPYRIEHLMHLELQWAMFVPLAFWAVHRTAESGRWKYALLTGLFVGLQFLCCIYYGVFLSLALIIFVPLLLTLKGHVPLRVFLPRLFCGGLFAGVLILPYAWPYVDASRAVGSRDFGEITRYSALPMSYLATNELNRLWGWTAERWGAPELRLFPGAIALVLAALSFRHPRRRVVLLYAATTLVVVELSFGLNSTVYRMLLGHVSALQNFRALARFGVIVGAAVAILAALGIQALLIRWPGRRLQGMIAPMMIGLLGLEYSNHSIPLSFAVAAEPALAYKTLALAGEGAIVEFPMPDLNAMPGWDPYYEAWSIWHWRPLLNGYSGFYPPQYGRAITELSGFPDERSIETLRQMNIRYVIIHRAFYQQDDYVELALKVASSRALKLWGTFKDPVGTADIFAVQ